MRKSPMEFGGIPMSLPMDSNGSPNEESPMNSNGISNEKVTNRIRMGDSNESTNGPEWEWESK
jgi:hypothetical protein